MEMSTFTTRQRLLPSAEDSSRTSHSPIRAGSGDVPQGWSVSSVGEQFSIQLGKMLDASKNIGVPKLYLGNRSVRWGQVDLDGMATVPMSPSDIRKYRLKRGDLLVCEGGEIGRSAIWDAPLPECYFQKALHRLRPVGDYNSYVMMSFLRLWASTGNLANYVTQTSIAHLPKEKLELIPLLVPPPAEQRAIAEVLSDVDMLLAAMESLIVKKRAIKHATMQQTLTGRIRLPSFDEDWENVTLGEIGEIKSGTTPSTQNPDYWDGTIPWCSATDVTNKLGKYLSDTERHITQTALGDSSVSLVPSGTILLCTRATIGELKIAASPVSISRAIKAIVCHDSVLNEFLYYRLILLKSYMLDKATGSTFLEIGKPDLSALEIQLPPYSEQCAIAGMLSDMDAEICAIEKRRAKVRAIKHGMLQQLLTGRIRLAQPNVSQEEEQSP